MNWVFQFLFSAMSLLVDRVCFLHLPFSKKNTSGNVSMLLLSYTAGRCVLQGLPLFLLCAPCWLQCHDLYVSLSSVLIHCLVLIQELIEHLVSCFRHLAHVAPSPVAFSGKRDHQRRLIDPFVNEGLQNVNDESGSLWMWTWFIYSSH